MPKLGLKDQSSRSKFVCATRWLCEEAQETFSHRMRYKAMYETLINPLMKRDVYASDIAHYPLCKLHHVQPFL